MKKIALTILACAGLCACNKEMTPESNPVQKTLEGDVAYVVVNINEVNSTSTRATSPGFEYGSADEYAVNDAHFYFYDTYGEYVAEATSWNSGVANDTIPATNIEFKANTVVTLQGLSGKSYPNWVVTILNQPAGFTAPYKLSDFETELAENNNYGYGTPGEYGVYTKGVVEIIGDTGFDTSGDLSGQGGTLYFTMSTSSYARTSNTGNENTYYYATPVSEENFSLEDLTVDSDGNYIAGDGTAVVPIEIYVERLVAKTRVGLGSSFANAVTGNDGETYYEISVEEGNGSDVDVNDLSLYVHLEGWELNGVSNPTYMMKNIDTSWGTASPYNWGWNDADNFRSYWAMYPGYNDNSVSWPTSSEGNDYDAGKNMNPYLRWFDLDPEYLHRIGVINAAGDYDYQYCGENTNTAGRNSDVAVIKSKRSAAITNALISATVGTFDTDGEFVPAELVRENGIIYTKVNYKVYAASHLYLYNRTGTGATDDPLVYTQIGPDDLIIVNDHDGYVHVEIDSTYAENSILLYVDPESNDGYGTVVSTTDATETTKSSANQYIDSHFNDTFGYLANGYTSGMMYYSIPIEHLNNDYEEVYTDTDGEEKILVLEGNYGMVRNHIYAITINSIENIGWGVFNPDEIIIPQEDIDTYSLTANINILSWKVVEQSTVL